jgi:hypothetical protein
MEGGPSSDPSISAWVDEHSDAELLPSGKVRCTVTQHELPANIELLRAHWAGKKYVLRKAQSKYDFTRHEPWIVPHKQDPHLLYCTLTKQPLSRQPKTVQGHISGKRFQRLLKERQEGGIKIRDCTKLKGKGRAAEELEDEGDEIFDSDDDAVEEEVEDEVDGDADEFLREGAFWDSGAEDADDSDADDADADDAEDAFWVRGSRDVANVTPVVDSSRLTEKKRKHTAAVEPAPENSARGLGKLTRAAAIKRKKAKGLNGASSPLVKAGKGQAQKCQPIITR